jgi:predicted ABC-type sugar transport system permease subunit
MTERAEPRSPGEGQWLLLVFFSVMSGLLFGLGGLAYGALVFGICSALLHLYRLELDVHLERQAAP